MHSTARHPFAVLVALLLLAIPLPARADQVVAGTRLMEAAESFVRATLKCPGARALGRVPDQRVQGGRVQLASAWTSTTAPSSDSPRVLVKIETRVDGAPAARIAILVEVERQTGRPAGTAGGRPGASHPSEVAPALRAAATPMTAAPPAPPPPMVVRCGDNVTLVLRASSGALELQVPATACANAPLGGTVRVQLEGSRRNVTARVVSDRQVESELP